MLLWLPSPLGRHPPSGPAGRGCDTGTWAWHPFGGEITGYATFDGVTIPSAGRVGWFFGTERWPAGEFFRYRITDLHLVTTSTLLPTG